MAKINPKTVSALYKYIIYRKTDLNTDTYTLEKFYNFHNHSLDFMKSVALKVQLSKFFNLSLFIVNYISNISLYRYCSIVALSSASKILLCAFII